MKKITILTGILIGAFALPSQVMAKTIQGCEVVDKGGYYNKVVPTCQFSEFIGSYGRELTVDPDGVPNTGDEFKVADQEGQDDLN